MTKRKIDPTVGRFNSYALVSRAVEEGVRYGWTRAHKHTDSPTGDGVCDAMEDAVLLSLSEIIEFPPYE